VVSRHLSLSLSVCACVWLGNGFEFYTYLVSNLQHAIWDFVKKKTVEKHLFNVLIIGKLWRRRCTRRCIATTTRRKNRLTRRDLMQRWTYIKQSLIVISVMMMIIHILSIVFITYNLLWMVFELCRWWSASSFCFINSHTQIVISNSIKSGCKKWKSLTSVFNFRVKTSWIPLRSRVSLWYLQSRIRMLRHLRMPTIPRGWHYLHVQQVRTTSKNDRFIHGTSPGPHANHHHRVQQTPPHPHHHTPSSSLVKYTSGIMTKKCDLNLVSLRPTWGSETNRVAGVGGVVYVGWEYCQNLCKNPSSFLVEKP